MLCFLHLSILFKHRTQKLAVHIVQRWHVEWCILCPAWCWVSKEVSLHLFANEKRLAWWIDKLFDDHLTQTQKCQQLSLPSCIVSIHCILNHLHQNKISTKQNHTYMYRVQQSLQCCSYHLTYLYIARTKLQYLLFLPCCIVHLHVYPSRNVPEYLALCMDIPEYPRYSLVLVGQGCVACKDAPGKSMYSKGIWHMEQSNVAGW